jgi:hypothetical protein
MSTEHDPDLIDRPSDQTPDVTDAFVAEVPVDGDFERIGPMAGVIGMRDIATAAHRGDRRARVFVWAALAVFVVPFVVVLVAAVISLAL